MFVFAPGAGCTGEATLVQPGDEMIFTGETQEVKVLTELSTQKLDAEDVGSNIFDGFTGGMSCGNVTSRQHGFNTPLNANDLDDLSHKNFSPDTLKKVKWVTKMYRDWRNFRESDPNLESIKCDLDDVRTITEENANYALVRFLTEVKKLDGSDFPGRTLYDILVCVQFHFETLGINWKLLNDDKFCNVKITLDNLMKLHTSQGLGTKINKAQILMPIDEDYLWSIGLLGSHSPEVLLNAIVFLIGKGCAL